MLNEEVAKYRELSGDTNPNTPISRIGGYLDGYEKALEQEPYDFAKWVAEEIFDDNWEYNKDAFAEIACRKLAKLGIVRAKGNEWELVEPQKDNGFYDEIMDDESDGEVYEKIKEIIAKAKEQEE